MYPAQITEKEWLTEANFARRCGLLVTFHWLNIECESIVNPEGIFQFLPPPVLNKQGEILI
jgi:hypothetical protein